ncbi:hypothetical protein ACFLZ2_02055 [Candidatus Margulisiibacteriota bacterium]
MKKVFCIVLLLMFISVPSFAEGEKDKTVWGGIMMGGSGIGYNIGIDMDIADSGLSGELDHSSGGGIFGINISTIRVGIAKRTSIIWEELKGTISIGMSSLTASETTWWGDPQSSTKTAPYVAISPEFIMNDTGMMFRIVGTFTPRGTFADYSLCVTMDI